MSFRPFSHLPWRTASRRCATLLAFHPFLLSMFSRIIVKTSTAAGSKSGVNAFLMLE